jgi:hypothetical protein
VTDSSLAGVGAAVSTRTRSENVPNVAKPCSISRMYSSWIDSNIFAVDSDVVVVVVVVVVPGGGGVVVLVGRLSIDKGSTVVVVVRAEEVDSGRCTGKESPLRSSPPQTMTTNKHCTNNC